MSLPQVVVEAVPLTLAGVLVPTVIGGYRWLRQVSKAVAKLTEVSHKLGEVTEAQAEHARQIRSTRRDLALHVRECRHPVPAPREPERAEL